MRLVGTKRLRETWSSLPVQSGTGSLIFKISIIERLNEDGLAVWFLPGHPKKLIQLKLGCKKCKPGFSISRIKNPRAFLTT
ncbi:protein of unknown function [Nitrospina watsonii]|uniref:Uncharacterized protein n=1 Tax=Nitrospina watsonii TaxID=1323948 RepID=A0ABM9HFP9_9BACT|nr:protein of unknown function [Nitrospina watsonii]